VPEKALLSKHISEMVAAMQSVETESGRLQQALTERFDRKNKIIVNVPDIVSARVR
jgi:hypothetical protein